MNFVPTLENAKLSFPSLMLENGDKLTIPPRNNFVYVLGAVNIEASILYKPGLNVNDYLKLAGLSNSSDKENSILLRADGSVSTSEGTWLGKSILKSVVMPGDFIIVPQRLDLENDWSFLIRNTKDITQIFYQLGLGAAAIKTLKN